MEITVSIDGAPVQVLGRFLTLDELQAIMRERREKLDLSFEVVDKLVGCTARYAAKVLAPRPARKLTRESVPWFAEGLALGLIAVDLPTERARITANHPKRNSGKAVHAGTVLFKFSRRHMRKIQRKGGENSRKNLPRWKRKALARKAARARWGN